MPGGALFSRKRGWQLVVLLWAVFAVLTGSQSVVEMHGQGMHHAWGRLFLMVSLSWIVWALATPIVVWLGRKAPPSQWKSLQTWIVHLGACLLLVSAYAAWMAWLQNLLQPFGPIADQVPFSALWMVYLISRFHVVLLLYTAILAISYTLDATVRLAREETKAAKQSAELVKAQLDALSRQIEPHFIFNALNTITRLIREKQNDTALKVTVGLGDLLRRAFESSEREMVELSQEIEFLRAYVTIQQLRFVDRLCVRFNVPEQFSRAQVPRLIIQPLVENAIRHGISRSSKRGTVEVTVARLHDSLMVQVRNDGPDLPIGWKEEANGVGLSNVRTRLQMYYGDEGSLKIRNSETGGVEATVSIPFRLSTS